MLVAIFTGTVILGPLDNIRGSTSTPTMNHFCLSAPERVCHFKESRSMARRRQRFRQRRVQRRVPFVQDGSSHQAVIAGRLVGTNGVLCDGLIVRQASLTASMMTPPS